MIDTHPDTNRLPLSVLNYFAAFTETRFNFCTLMNYLWTSDELTLDLSLFSGFTQALFERAKVGDNATLSIRPSEHTLPLLRDDILIDIQKALSVKFDRSYLKVCTEGRRYPDGKIQAGLAKRAQYEYKNKFKEKRLQDCRYEDFMCLRRGGFMTLFRTKRRQLKLYKG